MSLDEIKETLAKGMGFESAEQALARPEKIEEPWEADYPDDRDDPATEWERLGMSSIWEGC